MTNIILEQFQMAFVIRFHHIRYYKDVMLVSSYVDLFPIRNLYSTSETLGAYNSVSVNGRMGNIKNQKITTEKKI